MYSQSFGCPTGYEHEEDQGRDELHACPSVLVSRFQESCCPSNRKQHDDDERNQQQQRHREMAPTLTRTHHCCQDGQQQPGTNVINRCARNGHGSEAGSQQVALFQNTGKHREGGDAHCRSDEKNESRKRYPLTRKLRIEHSGQADA
ncbi:MAG TPA: hypothetical protein VEU94_05015 [Terriglobales bacterium]|nr:hypothetical protein [Terriglobales bacterium]